MPGLKQLQKFNSDIISLGNEPSLRNERGEKPVTVPIPKTVKDVDDSDDFVLGMPQIDPSKIQEKKPVQEDEDFSDITGNGASKPAVDMSQTVDVPDLSSLLTPEVSQGGEAEEVPDLSMFMEPVEEEAPEPEPEPEPKEIPISDLSLEDLLGGAGFDGTTGDDMPEEFQEKEEEEIPLFPPEENQDEQKNEPEPRRSVVPEIPEEPEPVEEAQPVEEIAPSDSIDEPEEVEELEEIPEAESLGGDLDSVSDFDLAEPVEEPSASDFDLAEPFEISDEPSAPAFDAAEDFASTSNSEDISQPPAPSESPESFEMPDDFSSSEIPGGFDLDKIDNMNLEDLSLEDLGLDADLPTVSDLDDDFKLPDENELNKAASEEVQDAEEFEELTEAINDATSDGFIIGSGDDDLNSGFTFDGVPFDMGSEENDAIAEQPEELDSLESSEKNEPASKTNDAAQPAQDEDPLAGVEGLDLLDEAVDVSDFGIDNLEALESLPGSEKLEPKEVSSGTDFTDATGEFDLSPDGLFDAGDLDTPDFAGNVSDFDLEKLAQEEPEAPAAAEPAKVDEDFDVVDLDSEFGDFGSGDGQSENDGEVSFESSENLDDMPLETFDTSEMEGMDFELPETDSQLSGGAGSDFDLGSSDDFGLDNGEFEIPGFSDVDTVLEGKDGKMKRPEPKQSAAEEVLEKNTLSDEQYKKFLKNLVSYPLNVRIAVEELIVKDEFTDDAEFEIIQKVLKKVSARQLASELEKMLDITILVPRDFERRTAEEYEAYKASFQYQLKNKIIPGTIIAAVSAAILYLLSVFVIFCIYRPMKANGLYEEGYDLLCNEQYPQAEQKFAEAQEYRKIKKWYYKFAEGFRERRKYLKAEEWYNYTLRDFDYDKKAGIDYTEMELYDRANYSKAENLAKRMILDHHINDEDGMLLLGDIYLEWATEEDDSKFDDAFRNYSELIQRYGSKNKYLGRQMRYYVRTDSLENVLTLKPHFMKDEDSLESDDWTELSGYCLDKLYGYLPPQREYLREKIEDVKEMLVRAVKADEENPTALYNLSRYYVEVKNSPYAKATLDQTIEAYKTKNVRRTKDIYNEIDAYRLLGEQYADENLFIDAVNKYTEGLAIYNSEHNESGLKPNEKIGKLYADYGDIDYFVEGNMNSALNNYMDSIVAGNDTPHIRYKIGYIQYGKQNYSEALGSFMKSSELYASDPNLLLAMGNTLALKNENNAASGYYSELMDYLETQKEHKGILLPQVRQSDSAIVNDYLKASNNYGVTLFKQAKRTGSSKLNASAIVQFQNSVRAWDALTRNQTSMVRLSGSNLAEKNIQYATHPVSEFEPALYTEISRTLTDEKGLIK